MKKIIILTAIALALIPVISTWVFVSCVQTETALNTPQGQAVLGTAEQIANIAGTAAATTYGGPMAGQLASAGLSALGSVLNGYIGSHVPQNIVKASPGVSGVGAAIAPLVIPTATVTTADVAKVNAAAAIAAKK